MKFIINKEEVTGVGGVTLYTFLGEPKLVTFPNGIYIQAAAPIRMVR